MDQNQTVCSKCGKHISWRNMARHLKVCVGNQKSTREPQRSCPSCSRLVTLSNLRRHMTKCDSATLKRKSEDPTPSPSKVPRLDKQSSPSTSAPTNTSLASVTTSYNIPRSVTDEQKNKIKEVENAFGGRMKTYVMENNSGTKDPASFLQDCRQLIQSKLTECVSEKNVKANLIFLVQYKKPVNNTEDSKEMNFKTKNTIILPTTDIPTYINESERKILAEMDDFNTKGSGWTLAKILSLQLRINRYLPLRGSTYIPLPERITAKKAVLNIRNNDHKCFLWSVLAALHPVPREHIPHRLHHYEPYEHELDHLLHGIDFPVRLEQIVLFEKRADISINVYAYDEKYIVYPLKTVNEEKEMHIDLLYVKNEETSHYCLIKDLSRLVRSQISTHCSKTWICRRCLLHYGTEDLLIRHKEDCKEHDAVKIIMPPEGSALKFEENNKSMRVPYAIYADFECMLSPIAEEPKPGPRRKFTEKYQKHEAISFCYYIVYSDGEYGGPVNYFGLDAAEVFVEHMLNESRKIYQLYSSEAVIPMRLTPEDLNIISTAQLCHICHKPFNDIEDKQVRDHDHLTGRFRGIAHNSCNLKYQKPHFIPIFIHNLSGYDTHLFIKMFGLNDETIQLIPCNEERYISYSVKINRGVKLRFLDSCRFMQSSLEKLAKNLSLDQFQHTSKYFSGEQLQLLVKKGVYPYDFMDSLDKYELISLPEKKDFFNKLNMEGISDKDYEHATNIWNAFNIQNMKEYTELYNKSDVLLLADIMENFRDVCLQTYQLDPAWYFTAPGLAWSAMLKVTNIELELLTDYNMILMIGKGVRGGVSQCSHRHAEANNPFMDEYNKDKPITYLTYLDANNLYGWAMSQHMPYKNFKWVDDLNSIDVTTIPDDSDVGFILEVDLEYPENIHDLHSDMPLAPEQRIPPRSKQSKLLLTLFNKENYVLHYRNLKQYLSLGMRLKKIHRAISFSQSSWLKSYIDLNTTMRTKASNDFEKDFYKLMNNSVFGKTMENIRNRVDIRLATKDKQVENWIAKPNFKHRTIFTEQLAAVHMGPTKLHFNKPIYVGMSILDTSKTLMYDFHYNTIKKKYAHKAQLQYTDTDSLTYLIETNNFYADLKEMLHFFDTSDYPEPNRYNIPRGNKKVIGKFKDELNGRIMYEHVGLRSKMYSSRSEKICDDDTGEIKKSKGVKMCVVKNEISFQDYKDCLHQFCKKYSAVCENGENNSQIYRSMNMIRSYRHDLYSVELNKIALSAEDDKRFISHGGIKTLPWGHYSIPEDVNLDTTPMET